MWLHAEIVRATRTVVARFDEGFLSTGTGYFHPDHLSVRVTTNDAGGLVTRQAHYPFGEDWPQSPAGNGKWLFTSYERDAETGNNYAMFCTHISRLGRFNRPDPLGGSIADPQSWNRYAYTLNDPVNLFDPLGLDECPAGCRKELWEVPCPPGTPREQCPLPQDVCVCPAYPYGDLPINILPPLVIPIEDSRERRSDEEQIESVGKQLVNTELRKYEECFRAGIVPLNDLPEMKALRSRLAKDIAEIPKKLRPDYPGGNVSVLDMIVLMNAVPVAKEMQKIKDDCQRMYPLAELHVSYVPNPY